MSQVEFNGACPFCHVGGKICVTEKYIPNPLKVILVMIIFWCFAAA